MIKVFISIFILNLYLAGASNNCIPRDYGNGGTVCVCTSQNCDTIDPIQKLNVGQYFLYTSSKEGLRFNKTIGSFVKNSKNAENKITINPKVQYQNIFGWGGAFTDSAGININSLNEKARDNLLRSYFSKEGLEYSLCRVPIGGTDFSTRPYTYDDNNPDDVKLIHFNLTTEDYTYKIPLIKEALSLTDNKLRLFASAWSAPAWMKTNNALSGIGYLRKTMYQAWADYHLKFLQLYKKEGIKFWGITTGNEPTNGIVPFIKINSMGWTPSSQSEWISNNLGPTIRSSEFRDIKIMALDDQRFYLPWWPVMLLKKNTTRDYIDGIAVHWYWDKYFPASLLSYTQMLFPEKFFLATEACVGDKPFQKRVDLGSWKRGEMYAEDIIQDLNNWVTGWLDWNMALDITGGPTYINNNVDSPIIVNVTAQEFYKQPMFYTLGHFSKFITPSSVRIQVSENVKRLQVVAFNRPDNGTTVILYNNKNQDTNVTLYDERRGFLKITVLKRSINTILYW